MKNKRLSNLGGILHKKDRKAVPIELLPARMIGFETNVLSRYLVRDDHAQFVRAAGPIARLKKTSPQPFLRC